MTPRARGGCGDLGGSDGGSEPTEEVGVGSCSLSAIEARGVTMTEVRGEDSVVDLVTVSVERLRSKTEGGLIVDASLGICACEGLGADTPGSFNGAADFDGVVPGGGWVNGSLGGARGAGDGSAGVFDAALLFEI